MEFNFANANAIGVIGGADGPTAIYTTSRLTNTHYVIIGLIIIVVTSVLTTLYKNRKNKNK